MITGEVVVYKYKGMYRIKDVGTLRFSYVDRNKKYYTLHSIDNDTDRIYVPTNDKVKLRKPVSKDEVFKLIQEIEDIEVLRVKNEKTREREYMECIDNNGIRGWMKMLKTLSIRLENKGKGKASELDKQYKKVAEHALYSELSYVLDIPVKAVKRVIMEAGTKNDLI